MFHIVLQRKRSEPSDSEGDEEDDFKVSEVNASVHKVDD